MSKEFEGWFEVRELAVRLRFLEEGLSDNMTEKTIDLLRAFTAESWKSSIVIGQRQGMERVVEIVDAVKYQRPHNVWEDACLTVYEAIRKEITP